MKKTLERRRLTRVLLFAQAATITGLLFWLYRENQTNDFMRAWLSRNFPAGLFLLSEWTVVGVGAGFIILTTYLSNIPQSALASYRKRGLHAEPRPELRRISPRTMTKEPDPPRMSPFYETIDLRYFVLNIAFVTQAVSLWFVTAADFRVSSFPPDSYYYLTNLPLVYWWGLAATLGTILLPAVSKGRTRTAKELSGLFLLSLYLIGLPSFSYQDPRFLDAYYHTGNSLELLNSMGWFHSPNWYVHQFPGAFSYIAQLSSVAGINPFQLMKYFPAGLALVVIFFAYVIARMFSPNNAAIASGLILGGFWFQLHASPQAFELPLYLGFLFIILKIIEDIPRRKMWTAISLVVTPIFVASHPETPIAVGLGLFVFLALYILIRGAAVREALAKVGASTIVLTATGLLWWLFIAVDARKLVQTSILDRAVQSLSQFPTGISPQNVPTTPASSYATTIIFEQVTSVMIWAGGLVLLLFIGRFRTRERLLYGFFLASVATIPIAAFARADVLQRSYLFALLPFGILIAWLLERRVALSVGGKSIYVLLKGGLIVSMLLFAALIPITRYGVDPFQYIPNSALTVDAIAAGIPSHSILFLHPEEDGWRFYAGLNGATSQPRLEQGNILNKTGGYFKPNSDPTIAPFNLTYTTSDGTAAYIVLSDYYVNVYVLRSGPMAQSYLAARTNFEGNVTRNFDLVYSTGLDRIYANRNVPEPKSANK